MMKRFWLALVVAWCLCLTARAQPLIPVQWSFTNYFGASAPASRLTIKPLPPYAIVSNNYVVPQTLTFTPATCPSMTNGYVTTNVYVGSLYVSTASGPGWSMTKTNFFPVILTNGGPAYSAAIYDVAGYQTYNNVVVGIFYTGTNFYSPTSVLSSGVIAGTGITIVTNGSPPVGYVINATATATGTATVSQGANVTVVPTVVGNNTNYEISATAAGGGASNYTAAGQSVVVVTNSGATGNTNIISLYLSTNNINTSVTNGNVGAIALAANSTLTLSNISGSNFSGNGYTLSNVLSYDARPSTNSDFKNEVLSSAGYYPIFTNVGPCTITNVLIDLQYTGGAADSNTVYNAVLSFYLDGRSNGVTLGSWSGARFLPFPYGGRIDLNTASQNAIFGDRTETIHAFTNAGVGLWVSSGTLSLWYDVYAKIGPVVCPPNQRDWHVMEVSNNLAFGSTSTMSLAAGTSGEFCSYEGFFLSSTYGFQENHPTVDADGTNTTANGTEDWAREAYYGRMGRAFKHNQESGYGSDIFLQDLKGWAHGLDEYRFIPITFTNSLSFFWPNTFANVGNVPTILVCTWTSATQ